MMHGWTFRNIMPAMMMVNDSEETIYTLETCSFVSMLVRVKDREARALCGLYAPAPLFQPTH